MSRLSAKSVMRLLAFTMVVFTFAASASIAAPPSVKLYASLQPERLGKSSTVVIGFDIATSKDVLPSPLTSFNVRLPAGMGLAGTTLGVDTCSAEALLHLGPSSCPPDAAMGLGSALAEAAFGSEIVQEPGQVSAFMTQARDNNTTVLYYFDGKVPVIAPLVFPSEFLSPGFSPISELETKLPLIPALPDTPDAAIVKMRVSLGPRHLTYYKRVGHRTVRYKPVGMAVPAVCPKGGFLFSAYLGFADGTHVSLEKRVACPSRR